MAFIVSRSGLIRRLWFRLRLWMVVAIMIIMVIIIATMMPTTRPKKRQKPVYRISSIEHNLTSLLRSTDHAARNGSNILHSLHPTLDSNINLPPRLRQTLPSSLPHNNQSRPSPIITHRRIRHTRMLPRPHIRNLRTISLRSPLTQILRPFRGLRTGTLHRPSGEIIRRLHPLGANQDVVFLSCSC